MNNAAEANIMTGPRHSARAKNLGSLLAGFAADVPAFAQVSDLSLDSRNIRPGAAFIALPGLRAHGVTFADDAVAAGATTVLWEPAAHVAGPRVARDVLVFAIPDLTRRLGTIADRFFDAPSRALRIAGVTGTNGKTTTAYVIVAALAQLGRDSAYAGTIGYGRVTALRPRTHTTPDCISMHRELAELREQGVDSVGMEVTSHALAQHRVAGVRIDTAVFTNLTRDHLDYHGTLEAYGATKARLFEWPDLQHAVINVDDEFGRALIARTTAAQLTICGRDASLRATAESRGCRFVWATRIDTHGLGLGIDIESSWGSVHLRSPMIGDFNVDNLLAALATLLAFDIPLADAAAALSRCTAPPGRMETLSAPGKPAVVIDYAHTPDALEKALTAIRSHCAGRVLCVFGCGGERDLGKRPLMGSIAERLADSVIVTDDNPRGEDGDAIVAGIVSGMQHGERAVIVRDRAAAIEQAIAHAHPGDVVLVAGKGHEDYQIVGAGKRHFSDRDVVAAALRRSA